MTPHMIFIITATAATLKEDATRIAEYVGTSDTQAIIANLQDYFETTGNSEVKVYASEPTPAMFRAELERMSERLEETLGKMEYCYVEPLNIAREEPPETTIQRNLRPRKDWQQKSYWLRIRSNPHQKNRHRRGGRGRG